MEISTMQVVLNARAMTACLNAIGAALPVLREDRAILVRSSTRGQLPDGKPDMATLEEGARPYVAEYDRAIAYCEVALIEVGAA